MIPAQGAFLLLSMVMRISFGPVTYQLYHWAHGQVLEFNHNMFGNQRDQGQVECKVKYWICLRKAEHFSAVFVGRGEALPCPRRASQVCWPKITSESVSSKIFQGFRFQTLWLIFLTCFNVHTCVRKFQFVRKLKLALKWRDPMKVKESTPNEGIAADSSAKQHVCSGSFQQGIDGNIPTTGIP